MLSHCGSAGNMLLGECTILSICAAAGREIPTAPCPSMSLIDMTPIRTGYGRMKCELVNDVDRLIEDQAAAWPLLARGLEGLRMSQTRTERLAGRELLIRHIPHRISSTTAAVDPVSVARRACFLCVANLPPEEQGIPFDSEFTIYCNPFPILDRHLSIVHNEHRPQEIAGSVEAMLKLAEALPDSFVLYNGPQCGASAPDHLHFQSCSRKIFPIERDNPLGYIPRVFALRDREQERLVFSLERFMTAFRGVA